ncbi:MAG: hypothetical protein J0H74_30225 [Chitinophagaceae bacterium]|nr:hypothetical protein [Chitinophagaceae bacterium]
MNDRIADRISQELGVPDLVEVLAERVAGSEFNSLLLAVYDRRVRNLRAPALLQQYRKNRFVQPSELDMIALLEQELQTLRFWKGCGFEPVELSPAAQWGSCSVVGTVSQNKIVSATRQTEIVADATNSIALHIADLRRRRELPVGEPARFCTVHRHIRTQEIKGGKGFTAHFKIGCIVSAGRDRGDHRWECQALREQMQAFQSLFREVFKVDKIRWKLQQRGGYEGGMPLIDRLGEYLEREMPGIALEMEKTPLPNDYYRGVQFKMIIDLAGKEWEIADGGFVDWTQQLLEDRKERLLIGGFGLELLFRGMHDLL